MRLKRVIEVGLQISRKKGVQVARKRDNVLDVAMLDDIQNRV